MAVSDTNYKQRYPACVACSKAKRKCSRQLPVCRRCHIQNITCVYLVTQAVSSDELSNLTHQSPSIRSQTLRSDQARVSQESAVPGSGSPFELLEQSGLSLTALWFLEPSSWTIDHVFVDEDRRITYPTSGLDFFLDQARAWLDHWVRGGHCEFIHPRLYGSSDLPGQLQHALAAWQTYRAATTPWSKKRSLQMMMEWSRNLINEQSIVETLGTCATSLLDQLSYTQALLIFQLIGLFDGDVKARAKAEAQLATLDQWADALMLRASLDTASNQSLTTDGLLNDPQITHLRCDNTTASAWKSWVLSESIRRTWIMATLTRAAFCIMKDSFAICPGSIGFTARQGVWEASSPKAWLASLEVENSAGNPAFCRLLDRLLDEAKPSDVNVFTQILLAYGRGREALEDWLATST